MKLTTAEIIKEISESVNNQMEYGTNDIALLSFLKSKLFDETLVPKDRRQEVLVGVNKAAGLNYTFADIKNVESPALDIIVNINEVQSRKQEAKKENNMNNVKNVATNETNADNASVEVLPVVDTQQPVLEAEAAVPLKDEQLESLNMVQRLRYNVQKQFNTDVGAGEKRLLNNQVVAAAAAVVGAAGVVVKSGLTVANVAGGVVGAGVSYVVVNHTMGKKEANATNLTISAVAGLALGIGGATVGGLLDDLLGREEDVTEAPTVVVNNYPAEA